MPVDYSTITKEELIRLVKAYDRYIQGANDDDTYDSGWRPVCVNEFYDWEFQQLEKERKKKLREPWTISEVSTIPGGTSLQLFQYIHEGDEESVIWWVKIHKKWIATIRVKGKNIELCSFDSEEKHPMRDALDTCYAKFLEWRNSSVGEG